jgi:hypothetical protein
MRITKKWRAMSEIYKRFCPLEDCYDFSETSALDAFSFESIGYPKLSLTDKKDGKYNGYVVGKHWMDATIKMWNEDLESGILVYSELEKDFPIWFLEKLNLK